MNLTLPAGGTSFALIHAAGQGPRNPRPLRELRNIGEKSHRITPAKRAAQTAVVAQFFTAAQNVTGKTSQKLERRWKQDGKLCLFVPMSFPCGSRKLLILSWRPRRDLNPCYRRESFSELNENVFPMTWNARTTP
jgi:hypothetical protein